MKTVFKRIFYPLLRSKTDEINKAINGAETVSFDVFDTLVKRDVPMPSDVFSLMEQQLLRDGTPDGKEFAKKRVEAEKSARMKYPEREVTLKEIYECLPSDIDNENRLMQLECETEIAVSTPHIPMKQIYEECARQGKTILFISDMYLPSDIILDILQKNGYTTGKLYVSSESGFTKRSGKLFTHIQKQENIAPNKWVHIGDTISSDYLIPKKLGIRSFLIERDPKYNTIVNRKLNRTDKEYQTLTQFINNRIGRYSDFYERLGYAVLGPLLYGFVKWLDAQDLEEETIVFLAREGALLKKAFEIVSEKPSVYLYISRRAALCTAISQIDDYKSVSQDNFLTMNRIHTNKELALNYGLSADEIKTLFSSAGLDENQIVTSSMGNAVLEAIWTTAKGKSERQHMLLQRYLEQLQVSDKCTVVDVGWKGTTQALLSQANFFSNGNHIRWNGYYMAAEACNYQITKKGFLFNNRLHLDNDIWQPLINTMSFFEFLFLSTDGTTKSYEKNVNGEVYPVKDNSENETPLVKTSVDAIQKAGLKFVADIKSSILCEEIQFDPYIASINYLLFVSNISLSDIKRFRYFQERNGDEVEGVSLVNEKGFLYYALHPKKFKKDFTRNYNKLFFLKGVFKLPLPYVSILTFLRKHF